MDVREQTIGFEGNKRVAYKDTEGVWTIGIGHTGPEVHEGLVWTDNEVNNAFNADLTKAIRQVSAALSFFPRLNEPRQAVLISMTFQMGLRGLLGFKNTLENVRQFNFEAASKGMLASDWARQTPNRARVLAEQMKTGVWQS